MPILPKDNHCCGCSACFSACPHDSITMAQDFCGFYHPKVDPSTCTECKLCEIACPTLPYLDFAPYNAVRKKSHFPYDVKSHSLDSRGIYVHFSWHKPSFYSKPLESSALDSSAIQDCKAFTQNAQNLNDSQAEAKLDAMDCHADKSARNDRSCTAQNLNDLAQDSKIAKLESGLLDSRQICSRLELGFSLSAWDSRIVDEKGLLSKETSPSGERYPLFCERSQGRILGVCNCSDREAIKPLSLQAESINSSPPPS